MLLNKATKPNLKIHLVSYSIPGGGAVKEYKTSYN